MDRTSSKYLLTTAIATTVACVLQIYGTLRYTRRLPDDTFGAVLYITTCVLFGVLATVYYFRWARSREDGES